MKSKLALVALTLLLVGCGEKSTYKITDYEHNRVIYKTQNWEPNGTTTGLHLYVNGRTMILRDYRVERSTDYQGPDKIVEGIK